LSKPPRKRSKCLSRLYRSTGPLDSNLRRGREKTVEAERFLHRIGKRFGWNKTVGWAIAIAAVISLVASGPSGADASPTNWPPTTVDELVFSAGPMDTRTYDLELYPPIKDRFSHVGFGFSWKLLATSESSWDWTGWPERFDLVQSDGKRMHLGAGVAICPDWFLAGPNHVPMKPGFPI